MTINGMTSSIGSFKENRKKRRDKNQVELALERSCWWSKCSLKCRYGYDLWFDVNEPIQLGNFKYHFHLRCIDIAILDLTPWAAQPQIHLHWRTFQPSHGAKTVTKSYLHFALAPWAMQQNKRLVFIVTTPKEPR